MTPTLLSRKKLEPSASQVARHRAEGPVTFSRTLRFAAELKTARWIRKVAKERNYALSLHEAHEVWAEYSNDYCATWMLPDAENPDVEAWRAISLWDSRLLSSKGKGMSRHE